MAGDAKRRFCEHCELHVHNLSAMSQPERDRFVEETGGQACIAYELRPDGTMFTPSLWRSVFAPFQRVRFAVVAVFATLLPFLFTACASRRTLGRTSTAHVDPSCKNSGAASGHRMLLGEPVPTRKKHE